MNFYIFNSDFRLVKDLQDANFTGMLFTYNANHGDAFTRIAKNIDLNSNFKYMVAVRPYVISPQYLSMICSSMQSMSKNMIQVNLISGHIKEEERNFGGVIGLVNDLSSSVDRSNYLIEYLDVLENINAEIPDYYVSITNNFTFKAAIKHNSKMIIPYSHYKDNRYDLKNKKVMISVSPILRKTQDEINNLDENHTEYKSDLANFTYSKFNEMVNSVQSQNINEIILSAWNSIDTQHIIDFVKQYKELEMSNNSHFHVNDTQQKTGEKNVTS